MTREEELLQQGWEKRITTDEPRLSEVAEMYREQGFEVHLEPFGPVEGPGRSDCFKMAPEKFQGVYTRRLVMNCRLILRAVRSVHVNVHVVVHVHENCGVVGSV